MKKQTSLPKQNKTESQIIPIKLPDAAFSSTEPQKQMKGNSIALNDTPLNTCFVSKSQLL